MVDVVVLVFDLLVCVVWCGVLYFGVYPWRVVSVWDFCTAVLLVWFDWQFVLVVSCLGVIWMWVGCMVCSLRVV